MRIIPVPFVYPPDPPRTGVHLSTILKDILTIKDPETYGQPITLATHGTFQKGYSWEDYLKTRSVWPADVILQQEFTCDRIICTLDGFLLTGLCVCKRPVEEGCVFESKATFISCARSILDPKFVAWKWQLMGYCWASGVRNAHLDALFLNGNYRPMKTEPLSWHWIFKRRELQENWRMITRHRDRMVREGRLKEIA